MDDYQDEYQQATQNAGIYTYGNEEIESKGRFSNLFFIVAFLLICYLGYHYLKHETKILDDINLPRLKIVDAKYTERDRELVAILDKIAVDTLRKTEVKKSERVDLSLAINSIVNNSDSSEKSLYIQSISKEIKSEKKEIKLERKEIKLEKKDNLIGRSSEGEAFATLLKEELYKLKQ